MGRILDVQNAGYTRPGGRTTLRNVSFSLGAGKVLRELGPNGVGETTLLCVLAGLEPLYTGTVWLDGQDIASLLRRTVGQHIGMMPQGDAPAFSFSVREMVEMGHALAQQPRVTVLDEPNVHLDFANQTQVHDLIDTLAGQGLAILLTTHDPGPAFRIGTAALLLQRDLSVIFGSTRAVLTETSLSAAYGRRVTLAEVDGQTVCLT